MKKGIIIILSLVAILSINAQTGKETAKKMFTEKTMPNVTLQDLNGKNVNLQEISKKGKVTIFNFWATWCTPCKKELNNMVDMAAEWKEKYGVEVIAVSIDDSRNKSKVKAYVDGQKWAYTVLYDENQELMRALNFQTVPYTVVVNKDGNIEETHNSYVEGDEFILQEKIEQLVK